MQRLTLFQNTEQPSPTLDPAFLAFHIPSAKDLYREIICRDQYELVSQLSWGAIKNILLDKNCNLKDFAREADITFLSETHYHYIFYFRKMDDVAARERLIAVLSELRHAEANKDTLFLDTNILKLHFYQDYSYGFDAKERQSILPHAYRALCIYDLIVEELYRHNLMRIDNDYTNCLISDYLSIHSQDLAKNNGEFISKMKVTDRLTRCLKSISCDRRSAAALHWGFNQISWQFGCVNEEKGFDRGAMVIVPLTPEACLNSKPNKKYFGKRNQYSHYYCSLIQYRYLMDLKSLFSFVNENILKEIKDHMTKWEDFKTQPIITKYEALINKIENIRWEKWQKFSDCARSHLYWEEDVSESGDRIVCIKAFSDANDWRLLEKYLVEETQKKPKAFLKIKRCNSFPRCDPRYNESYYLVVKQKDLAECPLKNLLTYSMAAMQTLDNPVLEKLTLSNLQFFKTMEPWKWLDFCCYDRPRHGNEMRAFIWMQAAWLMIRDWACHYKHELPMDILLTISDFLKGLLVLDYNKPQISTKRLQ